LERRPLKMKIILEIAVEKFRFLKEITHYIVCKEEISEQTEKMLKSALVQIDGIKEINIGERIIGVEKRTEAKWEALQPRIEEILREAFSAYEIYFRPPKDEEKDLI